MSMHNYHSMATNAVSILHIVCFNYVSHMLKNISYNLHYVQSPKQTAHKSVLQVRNVIIKSITKSFSIENILL